MAVPRSERTTRDEGILKLVLYLLRNITVINPTTRLAAEGDEEETSRSATIKAFQDQDAFALLLTMCSNIGDDFNMQDVALLEILFHILKGVDVEQLFMNDAQRSAKRTDELDDLLRQESSLRREYAKNAPTRHGRFGTMIWVKRDDAKVSTVSGQDVLKDSQATLDKMDQSKKWNKPQQRQKKEWSTLNNDFSTPVHLSSVASKNLRMFVEEFLDSGFNPLFTHVRKSIEREADRVLPINSRQYFYTVAWLLKAERARRQRQKRSQNEKSHNLAEPDNFGLVASVLNQETFVFLNRSMQYSFDNKDWEDLNAEMRCFTQILLTVQEMALSPLEEDQDIAENIQNRIFYEETTHDRILAILRGFKDQGFGYLDAATELSHVFLRMLERYSKENADMQVRSLRRARHKNKESIVADEGNDEDPVSEDEDEADAERVSRERGFDFRRFSAKFCNQKCVDTFVALTKYYKELNLEQLKRAHRYFYRIAFKQEMSVLLFRVDIINLFYRMIKGPGAMDSSKSIYREWEELVQQIIRRLIKKIDQRPALITELLFSKINSTVYYLEYGHEKQTLATARRPPAELEVSSTDAKTLDEKIGIVIGALILDEQGGLIAWVGEILQSAAEARESWETQANENPTASRAPNPMIAVKPRDDACQKAMFSNAKLRLLMTLVKLERLGVEDVPGASWIVPASLSSKDLQDMKSIIDRCLDDPMTGDLENDPREMLRRKYPSKSNNSRNQTTLGADFGSESEGEDLPLFPPNPRSKTKELDQPKKNRKKRNEDADQEPLDEEALEARRQKRLENTRDRQAKIKSNLYVHASDEETDEDADKQFFILEEKRRKNQAERVRKALLSGAVQETDTRASKGKRRKKRQSGNHTPGSPDTSSKRQRRAHPATWMDQDNDVVKSSTEVRSPGSPQEFSPNLDAEGDLEFDDDLAFSRNRNHAPESPAHGKNVGSSNTEASAEKEEDYDDRPVAVPARRRIRGGFVIDSDTE
ncbi:hypothetical protein EYZ11_004768 [Aspergillus tanneri]|nr:hypothetical protein EYZ11_004768 [Aspergillus tanneri]